MISGKKGSVRETSPAHRLFRPRGRNWLTIRALSSASYVLPSKPATFRTYLPVLPHLTHHKWQFLYRLLQYVQTLTFVHIMLLKNMHKLSDMDTYFFLVHTNLFYWKFLSIQTRLYCHVYMSFTYLCPKDHS